MNDSTEVRAPTEARKKFLEELRIDGKSEATVRAYASLLNYFTDWCSDKSIDDLGDLTGNHLRKWKHARKSRRNDLPDGERLSPKTLRDDIYMTRAFIRWVAQMGVLPFRIVKTINVPEVDKDDEVRYEYMDVEVAEQSMEYWGQAAPGTLHHVLIVLDWHTSMRLCSLHSIDLCDVDDEKYYIRLRHRPDTGTTLKDGYESERKVGIAPEVMEVINQYIEYHRYDIEDEYGREPLFTSQQGRRSKSNLREHFYELSQPCKIGDDCPHGRDPKSCDAAIRRNDASKCPSSMPPHSVRKGVITHWCDEDTDRDRITGRSDVTREVIEKHYDQRSEMERMEQRREFFM